MADDTQRELARRRGLDRQRLADAVASPLPDLNRRTAAPRTRGTSRIGELVERTRLSSGFPYNSIRGTAGRRNDPDDNETLYQDEGVGNDKAAGGGEEGSPITGGIAPEGGVTGDSGRSVGELSDNEDNENEPSSAARAGANVAVKALETAQPEAKVIIEGAKALGIDVEGVVAKRLENSPLGLVAGALAGDVKKQLIVVLSLTGAALLMILTFSLFIGGIRYVACTGFSGIVLSFSTDGLCDTLPKENQTTNVNSAGQVK